MSKYVIDDSTLSAIGDAVREKDGTTDKILVSDLATRILAIEGGGTGEGYEPPAEALALSGNLQYKFAYNNWNWFIEDFGDKITTSNITNLDSAFRDAKVKAIPFEINLDKTCSMSYTFYGTAIEEAPTIKGTLNLQTANYTNALPLTGLFANCFYLRNIPDDYFTFGGQEYWDSTKNYTANRQNLFNSCYSLRNLPDINNLMNNGTGYSGLYYCIVTWCCCLDEITNFPVSHNTLTSNNFMTSFDKTYRIKDLIFKTNEDGTPIVANWKTQTIDLSSYSGWGYSSNMFNYNSGITEATEISDDASYQALKDNVDSWTELVAYSRYNHDSAVRTINSLPDTSAYLATAGGTNTIKFKGAAGELTDGGAINTLTEEEIAVAVAKGWTVTLS